MFSLLHFVNIARKADTARTLEFALSRARSPARLPTNSNDFRAFYLASGFGVTAVAGYFVPSYAPILFLLRRTRFRVIRHLFQTFWIVSDIYDLVKGSK